MASRSKYFFNRLLHYILSAIFFILSILCNALFFQQVLTRMIHPRPEDKKSILYGQFFLGGFGITAMFSVVLFLYNLAWNRRNHRIPNEQKKYRVFNKSVIIEIIGSFLLSGLFLVIYSLGWMNEWLLYTMVSITLFFFSFPIACRGSIIGFAPCIIGIDLCLTVASDLDKFINRTVFTCIVCISGTFLTFVMDYIEKELIPEEREERQRREAELTNQIIQRVNDAGRLDRDAERLDQERQIQANEREGTLSGNVTRLDLDQFR